MGCSPPPYIALSRVDPPVNFRGGTPKNCKEDWIIDSGCSNNMTNDDKKLEDNDRLQGKESSADGRQLEIIYFSCWEGGHSKVCSLTTPT